MFSDSLRRIWRSAAGPLNPAVEVLFPPQCLVCHHRDQLPADRVAVCEECRRELFAGRPKLCRRCAMPVPDSLGDDVSKCSDCLRRRLFFRRAEVLQLYRGPARQLVLRIKEPSFETLALAAGRWLGNELKEMGWQQEIDLITAVPLHWVRRLGRGYHAAEVLAAGVAEVLERPLFTDLLYCRRWTLKQSALLPDERQTNMRRAMGVAGQYRLTGGCVLVIDDVITTGATAAAAAKALRQAGAREVRIAAIARGTGEA